jgi:hypothetical protein
MLEHTMFTELPNPWCNLVNTKCRHINDLDCHNRTSPVQDKLEHKAITSMQSVPPALEWNRIVLTNWWKILRSVGTLRYKSSLATPYYWQTRNKSHGQNIGKHSTINGKHRGTPHLLDQLCGKVHSGIRISYNLHCYSQAIQPNPKYTFIGP